jgi:hypothetical protein
MRYSKAIATLLLGAAACGDSGSPMAPDAELRGPGRGPSSTIWDAAHAAPDSKLYFLPPMVKNPHDDQKAADGTLSPIVEVCELNAANNACARLIERYGPTGGTRTNENVRWLGNHYQVNFHGPTYSLNVDKRLRVTVLVNDLVMGWADVIVGRTSKELKWADDDEFVTMTTSETLPIKFRVGVGIAGGITLTPPLDSVAKGQTTQYTAAVTDLHGAPLTGVPITWSSSDPSIATVDANGLVTTHAAGTVTITATAERVSATATLVVTPLVVRVEVTSVTINVGETATVVATGYDANGNPVLGVPVTWTIQGNDGTIIRVTSISGETVELRGVSAGVATLNANMADVTGTGTATVLTDLDLPEICTDDGLRYFGSTTVLTTGTCGIRLTPSEMWQSGTAWSSTKQPVANGFEVRFQMRMSDPGPGDFMVQGNTDPGADGIVFVLQNMAGSAVGNSGIGLGYQGLTSSVAVEFDTWLNQGEGDPSGNHVSIHTNGLGPNNADESYSIGRAVVPGTWYDGLAHNVVIRYVPGTITVSIDGEVVLTAPLTLTNVGGANLTDAEGMMWAGFTSATGAAYGTHDILSWSIVTDDLQ